MQVCLHVNVYSDYLIQINFRQLGDKRYSIVTMGLILTLQLTKSTLINDAGEGINLWLNLLQGTAPHTKLQFTKRIGLSVRIIENCLLIKA